MLVLRFFAPTVGLSDEHIPAEPAIEPAGACCLVLIRNGEDDAIASGKTEPPHGMLYQPVADPPIPPVLLNLEVGEPAPSSQ
jgi:hypothetical protein